jgi:drug/metabolite transporter (DMT)-like permease
MAADRPQHVAAGAAATMVLAIACFSVLDAVSKHVVARYPADFVVWMRYMVQTLLLVALLAPRLGLRLVATESLALQLVRGLLMVASSLLMVLAFHAMPLADATAINYTAPTIVMVLAFLFLGERVTAVRLGSVIAGLVGVVLIVRPGSTIFQPAAAFPLIAAAAGASYQVLTRKLAREDARTMMFYTSIVGAVVLTLTMPWRGAMAAFAWLDLVLLAIPGLLACGGHFLFIRAFQRAPASGLASITYVQLVFATAIGFIAFGDFPDGWTILGMLVIAVSGLFLTLYERRRHLVQEAEPPAID